MTSLAVVLKNNLSISVLRDRVLLKKVEREKSKGGIILPESAQQESEQAEVLAVGPGKLNEDGSVSPMDVSVGDIVILAKYSGQKVDLEGEEYMIAKSEDIVAKLIKEGV